MLSRLNKRTKNIRNVCIVGHVGHGKTTIATQMLHSANKNIKDGQRRRDDDDDLSIYYDDGYSDDRKTMYTSFKYEIKEEDMPLVSECKDSGRDFLITLIDPTGHVDNDSEVISGLRVTDGCIVIADIVTGVGRTTETLMRHAFAEHTCPVLLLNRLDVSIGELEFPAEHLYSVLERAVWTYNKIVDIYGIAEYKVSPGKGCVAFASAKDEWAFTLDDFARMYTAKFNIEFSAIREKLWGDNFFNPREKKWETQEGRKSIRGFLQFVLEPIYKVYNVCKYQDRESVFRFSRAMELPFTATEQQARRVDFIRMLMRKFLPLGEALLKMTVLHLPSPVSTQARKTVLIYEGDSIDQAGWGMKKCDPNAGLMMYVSRLIPSQDRGRLYAVGRVFGGTVSRGLRVSVRGPSLSPRGKGQTSLESEDGTVSSVYMFHKGVPVEVEAVPCGNVCAVFGIDKLVIKTATLTTVPKAQNIRPMTFNVKPVVSTSVAPRNPRDLQPVMEGLKELQRLDIRMELQMTKIGELYIWTVNEQHMKNCLHTLRNILGRVEIKTRGPFLPYKETVVSSISETIRLTTPNGKNKISVDCVSLPEGCVKDVDAGKVYAHQDATKRAEYLEKEYKIDATCGRKIWCFGPDGKGPNMLIDCIEGGPQQSKEEIEPTLIAGFQWVTKKGVLCEEAMRGVRYNLHRLVLDEDPDMRTSKEVFPTMVRLYQRTFLTAKPRLMQPMFQVEVQCPESASPGVFETITKHHGRVTREQSVKDWDTYYVEATLPVAESFGFERELLRVTRKAATMMQCTFDSWEVLPGTHLDGRSKTAAIIRDLRTRKGLNPTIPTVEDFL